MFFGLKNLLPVFQRFMDRILSEPDGNPVPIRRKGYMDDTLVPGKTRKECREGTLRVLAKMEKHGLPANPKKCAFEQEKINPLGYVVGEGKIEMDPEKVEGLAKWPTPETLKQVQQFLGFGNFYRRFIHHYSELARLLHNLLKKDAPFEWTEECEKAFQTLKEKFTTYPVLRMPDQMKPFQIEADASKYALGAVLTQQDEKGGRHPVAFLSKMFDQAQRNYQIYDRELLAIIRVLEEW